MKPGDRVKWYRPPLPGFAAIEVVTAVVKAVDGELIQIEVPDPLLGRTTIWVELYELKPESFGLE